MNEALAILLAYLWGAIPSAYLLAKYLRGIDIRRYGSGNVGASNVTVQLGPWLGLSIGTFDCLVKGTLPVVLAKLLGLGLPTQVAVGLAAVAGHNWSPYLGFTGGRGVATAIGTLVAFLMWRELLIFGAIGIAGRLLLKETAVGIGIGIALLPLCSLLFRQPLLLVFFTLGLVGLLALKRITANWLSPPPGHPLGAVLLYRLLFDRDVRRREDWVLRASSGQAACRGGT